ncbi:hypothetical protein B0H14DRAFT_2395262 [Mycena olivaceomarginata]|nr:hypothetical protein B0H14DRAFT_2395262 [Mycena olivaceomarginata]
MSSPAFKNHMVYAPERLYSRKEGGEDSRIFDEMWTAECRPSEYLTLCAKTLPVGACISGVIVSSDKTQLSQFSGDKTAWPVYLTIGNISKDLEE